MSYKNFNGGLGRTSVPFDDVPQTSTTEVDGVKITVDLASRSSLGRAASSASLLAPSVVGAPSKKPVVLSNPSGITTYNTLFSDFHLSCIPVYNFWVADELINDSDPLGNRKLDDVPRYILLTWSPAPKLLPKKTLIPAKSVKASLNPTKVGSETERPVAASLNGVHFSPAHLQPSNFGLVVQNAANGYVSPGVVKTVIDLDSRDPSQEISAGPLIDEDSFLADPDSYGITLADLIANSSQERFSWSRLKKAKSVSGISSSSLGSSLIVQQQPGAEGEVLITGADAESSQIMLKVRTSVGREPQPTNELHETVVRLSDDATPSQETTVSSYVNFSNTSLGGTISDERLAGMSRPEHAESIVGFAQIIHNLEALANSILPDLLPSKEIPSFASTSELPPIEYVGYLIEKYKRNSNGTFTLVDQIMLPSRDYDQYVDTKVVYGEVYRYRMRCVARWNRPGNVSPFGISKETNLVHGSAVKSAANYQSSYFMSEWSKNWTYGFVVDPQPPAPPDELQVRPDSANRQIVVTFKVPNNSQRDILMMRLYRKIQDAETGRDLSDWKQVVESDAVNRAVDFSPQNTIYFDKNVDFVQNNRLRYVYAARSFSRHHAESAFSEQIAASLNSNWATEGEFEVRQLSCAGVSADHFGAFSVKPFRRVESELVVTPPPHGANKPEQAVKAVFAGRNKTGKTLMNDAVYTVRIKSLDTGEEKDYQLSIVYKTSPDSIGTISNDSKITAGTHVHSSISAGLKKTGASSKSVGNPVDSKVTQKPNQTAAGSTSIQKNMPRKI